MKRSIPSTLISAYLLLPVALAQPVSETVSTSIHGQALVAKGNELRTHVNELVAMVLAKRLNEAEQLATDLARKFEASFDPNLRHHSFQWQEEYLEFKDASPQEFEWIDWGYKECLQMKAFMASERRDFALALTILEAIERLAPAAASAAAERGYILNQVGKPDEALAAYQRSLSLAKRFHSQRAYQAPALRGMGFSLIEMQRLDEAENAFRESLEVEPDNKIALGELGYIRQLRAKR